MLLYALYTQDHQKCLILYALVYSVHSGLLAMPYSVCDCMYALYTQDYQQYLILYALVCSALYTQDYQQCLILYALVCSVHSGLSAMPYSVCFVHSGPSAMPYSVCSNMLCTLRTISNALFRMFLYALYTQDYQQGLILYALVCSVHSGPSAIPYSVCSCML